MQNSEETLYTINTYMLYGLIGGTQCHLSVLRKSNVPCCYFLNDLVDFEIVQCCLSILTNAIVPCLCMCYDTNRVLYILLIEHGCLGGAMLNSLPLHVYYL